MTLENRETIENNQEVKRVDSEIKIEEIGREEKRGTETPHEIMRQNIEEAREAVLDLDVETRYEIKNLEKSSGLTENSLQQARQEAGIKEEIGSLRDRALQIFNDAKKKYEKILEEPARPIVAPIKYGELFFPELELAEIRTLPREKQRQALEEYKEKLSYQKEGLAFMQSDLKMRLSAHPDTPADELMEVVDLWGKMYGFTVEQKIIVQKILDGYKEKHEAIYALTKKYGPQDDAELFKDVFGTPPKGNVEVIEGSVTLCFRCHNLEDYALIYYQKFSGSELSAEEKERANLSGGVSISSAPPQHPELAGTIIAEKAMGRAFGRESQSIVVHEEQHALNRLFKEVRVRENTFEKMKRATTEEEQKNFLLGYFRYMRAESGEGRAKDEILAYLEQGGRSAEEIFKILTKPEKTGGLYDYFEIKRGPNNTSTKQSLPGFVLDVLNKKGDAQFVKMVKGAAEKVFEDEYKELIKTGLAAYSVLVNAGYTKEQALAVLMKKPLSRWGKEASRQASFMMVRQ